MDRLRVNETDHLSYKQKEELFKPLLPMNGLLEGVDAKSLDRYALPVFKQVLEAAAESSYIKHHGFRLRKARASRSKAVAPGAVPRRRSGCQQSVGHDRPPTQ